MLRTVITLLLPASLLLALPSGHLLAQVQHIQMPVLPELKLPPGLTLQPLESEPDEDELRKLLKERYNAALREFRAHLVEFQAGGNLATLLSNRPFEAANRMLETALALTEKPEDHVRLREAQVAVAKDRESVRRALCDAGRISVTYLEHATYDRLDAEIKLLQAKRKAAAGRQK